MTLAELHAQGKVRDIYEAADQALVMVATDRISAFDVVLPTDIPGKGQVLTPDSSRFWDAASYAPGGPQASYDKQYVRDWLERRAWDRTAPGPELPSEVVAGTRERYVTAFERITGARFQRYLREDVIAP